MPRKSSEFRENSPNKENRSILSFTLAPQGRNSTRKLYPIHIHGFGLPYVLNIGIFIDRIVGSSTRWSRHRAFKRSICQILVGNAMKKQVQIIHVWVGKVRPTVKLMYSYSRQHRVPCTFRNLIENRTLFRDWHVGRSPGHGYWSRGAVAMLGTWQTGHPPASTQSLKLQWEAALFRFPGNGTTIYSAFWKPPEISPSMLYVLYRDRMNLSRP